MKKLLSYLLILIITASTFSGTLALNTQTTMADTSSWPTGPSVFAKTGVLIDADSGTVLYDKKCDKKMYPASITKIMTALLTIENCSLDETVTFSSDAVNSLNYDDANIGCQVGEKMTVKECLYALMLSSANEVATALGEHIAGSITEFAKMMNNRAKEAGAKNTHFANANGLFDKNHYVTAYDMAMITRAALKHQVFQDIVNSTSYTIPKNNKRKKSFTSYQRHKMVWPTSGFYYEGIIGGKTGFTNESGTTLVTCAKRNGITLISVVLHSNGEHVYPDTKTLLDYGFKNYTVKSVAENDTRFSNNNSNSLKSPFSNTNNSINISKDSTVIIPKNVTFADLSSTVNFDLQNDSFATVTYKYANKVVGTAKLVYNSTSSEKNESITTNSSSTTNETTKEETTTIKSTKTKTPLTKNSIIMIILAVLILIVIIIILYLLIDHHRKIKKIRENKRNRERYN